MPFTAQVVGTGRCVSMLDLSDAALIADPQAKFECKETFWIPAPKDSDPRELEAWASFLNWKDARVPHDCGARAAARARIG